MACDFAPMDDPVSIGEAGAHEIEAVRRLFRDYAGTLPFDLAYQGFEQELAGLPQPYAAPTGALLVARDGQARVLGTVGVRRLQDDAASSSFTPRSLGGVPESALNGARTFR